LAVSGYGGNIAIWNLETKKKQFSKKLPNFGAYCIQASKDGRKLFIGMDNHQIQVVDLPQ